MHNTDNAQYIQCTIHTIYASSHKKEVTGWQKLAQETTGSSHVSKPNNFSVVIQKL